MENGTYLIAVTVKDCQKKDRRLAANRRTVQLNTKISKKAAEAVVAIGKKTNNPNGADIIEDAIGYYAKLVREGVKVG